MSTQLGFRGFPGEWLRGRSGLASRGHRTAKVTLCMVALGCLVGCGAGGGYSNQAPPGANPNPSLAPGSLNPSSAVAGGPGFTLTVTGSGFSSPSIVQWNGSARTTTFVSSTSLKAAITAADIATPGTAQISVSTPAPGGGMTSTLTFTIVPRALVSLQVTPGNPSITTGTTQQFNATGIFNDGSKQDLTASATWSSSNKAVATVNGSGLATGLTLGRVQITATSGSISGSTTLIAVTSETAGIPRFAYVADIVDGTLSEYTVNPMTGQLRTNGYTFAGRGPQAVVVDPHGKFAYVANSGDNNVSAFSIDNASGTLTPVTGSPFSGGSNPISVAVDPSGAFAYVVNSASNNVSAFSIDPATGALTSVAGSPFGAGANPNSIVVDPSGAFAYVANVTSNNVSGYMIDPTTGALTAVAGSPFSAGSAPSAVTIDPSGHFAYVANSVSIDVSAFSINSATGALTALPGSPFATGAGMEIAGVTVDPSGKFLFVANFGSSSVSAFTISASGALAPVAGSPFPVDSGPRSIEVDPAGKFAYVPNLASDEVEVFSIGATGALNIASRVRTRPQAAAIALSMGTIVVTYTPKFAYVANLVSNDVSGFTIDVTSGALTPVAGSPFPAGSGPFGAVVDPFGKFVYVTNGNSVVPVTNGDTVSAYSIDANTGALVPVPGSPFARSGSQSGVPTVDPSGRFLYVPNFGAFNVSAYSIDPTSGALAPIPGSPFPAAREPVSAAVDPSGRFLYVANQNGSLGGLSAYAIDPLTGVLTQIAGSPFPAGPEPSGVAVDPSGRFVYVANQSTNTTFEFAIDPTTGALAEIGMTLLTGAGVAVTVEPSGRFAYVTDGFNNNVAAYSIDPTKGTLTQITGSPFATGSIPFSITADLSGKFMYVASQGDGVSAYTIDTATGTLTPVTGSSFPAGSAPISVTTTGKIQ
jgi:6-phosphogluconolactonase (cycloisomerase 2 family)